jgi:magnesium chelatase family protein
MLIASMNPCPCGFYNHPEKSCMCGSGVVQRYLSRLSGPLLDRIDIHLEVVPVPFEKLANDQRPAESSQEIRKRVEAARLVQAERFSHTQKIHCNAQMSSRLLQKHCYIGEEGQALLKNAMNKLGLSARAYDRILKVSRTIADLENSQQIATHHLAEAIQYRSLDRDGWAG